MTDIQIKDFEWFKDNYQDLYNKHGVSYIAIKNQEVIGVYDTIDDAIDKVVGANEPGTFIIQYCNGDESAYTAQITSMFDVVV